MKWMKGMSAVRATTGALVGQVGHLFGTDGEIYDAVLEIDTQPSIFSSASMLKPGRRHDAKVRLASADAASSAVRSVCIKVPEVYGLGRDQDFLLASSGDGAPLHHCALPVAQESSSLYSSLWLYLVGSDADAVRRAN